MADFLTRLAQRTLGLVPVVEPLIAPMFAQGLPMPPEHELVSPPGPLVEKDIGVQPEAPKRPAAPVNERPLPRATPAAPRIEAPETPEMGSSTEIVPPPPPSREITAKHEAPERPLRVTREVSPSEVAELPHPEEHPPVKPVSAPQPRRGEWLPPEPIVRLERVVVPPRVRHRVAPPPVERPLPTPPVLVRRPGVPEAAAPPPEIRVTIGRVEVRSVTAPAPSPPPSPARRSSALSLEEYLRQRNEGKR